jgi:hypothetical protein
MYSLYPPYFHRKAPKQLVERSIPGNFFVDGEEKARSVRDLLCRLPVSKALRTSKQQIDAKFLARAGIGISIFRLSTDWYLPPRCPETPAGIIA